MRDLIRDVISYVSWHCDMRKMIVDDKMSIKNLKTVEIMGYEGISTWISIYTVVWEWIS